MGELSAIIGMLSAMDWNDCPQSQESAPIDQPHGAGQPRRGSPADHLAEAGRVWGAEAGALLAALEVEACEAALEAEACEAVDAGADAAEGALMLP